MTLGNESDIARIIVLRASNPSLEHQEEQCGGVAGGVPGNGV